MYNMYMLPSFYAHIINGLLLLVAFVIFYKNYSKMVHLEPYKKVILILVFSIGVGIHGLSHLGLEQIYNFNPMQSF